jgi:hypothetical protein
VVFGFGQKRIRFIVHFSAEKNAQNNDLSKTAESTNGNAGRLFTKLKEGNELAYRAHDVAEDDAGRSDERADDRHQVVVQHKALGAESPTCGQCYDFLNNFSKSIGQNFADCIFLCRRSFPNQLHRNRSSLN